MNYLDAASEGPPYWYRTGCCRSEVRENELGLLLSSWVSGAWIVEIKLISLCSVFQKQCTVFSRHTCFLALPPTNPEPIIRSANWVCFFIVT